MCLRWEALRARLAWRLMPKRMKASLIYAQRLATDLFISLPEATKRTFISHAQRVLGYPTFIETGTFMGDTSWHASHLFSRVHTIELDAELAERAARRFAETPNVTVHHGDSATVLPELLTTIASPCVFWLDGHYSGGVTARGHTDTPIVEELRAIAAHPVRPHAILIDDARVFGTDRAYPTLEEAIRLLGNIDPGFHIVVSSDIIWAAPDKLLNFEWRTTTSGLVVPPSTATDPALRAAPPDGRRSTVRAS